MSILYLLEGIRMPVLNEIMLLITKLGEETAVLVAAMVVYWCVDKRKGYYLMTVGFVGTLANQFLKLTCRVPRPWVQDPDLTILEDAREAATGYSFPSGHSQSAVGTFGSIAVFTGNPLLKGICIAICVLVPFSRMYIGVHTPADVLVGSAMALVLIVALRRPILRGGDRTMYRLIAAMVLLSAAFLLYVETWPFPVNMDPHNLESGMKNAYTMLGCTLGIGFVYPLERRFVNFSAKATWQGHIIKLLGGFALVLLVKEGLRDPLDLLFAGHLAGRAVRYFLIVLTAGLLWPMTFRRLSKIGEKNVLRNH